MTASPSDEPIVIVGSRLQALILVCIAAALAVAVAEWWAYPVAAALAVWALAIFVRRAELGAERVSFRRLGFGTVEAERGQVAARCDHRYLSLGVGDAPKGRIEVPVEIRPQVRAWSEETSPGLHVNDPN